MQPNMIGAFGPWAAELTKSQSGSPKWCRGGDATARLAARRRVLELIRQPARPTRPPVVQVLATGTFDGLHVEQLRWQLAYGPPTDAVLLKPSGATGKLPGVLGLHCHGGKKYWGWPKIAAIAQPHPLMAAHHQQYYGGQAWANELARRGYVVLVHDAYDFGSRRVRPEDCPDAVRQGVCDPDINDHAGIQAYNAWAGEHENIMAKSLFCAGTTWPGVFSAEDMAALDVLAARPDVDAQRLGCGGLSGGGLRTCLLAGLDDRIKACACVGFMTTWRDFLLHKCHTHTWMIYVPLLPAEMDFPEILGLRAPAPTMVLNTTEDQLFTQPEVRRSEQILRDIFAGAKAADRLAFNYYPGPHKFDAPMQNDAFAWFDRWLK